jgi:hypothetical protein
MCLIQFCVATPHFYSFYSKQLLQLPSVAEQSQEKITIKIVGFSLHPGASKIQQQNPKI